MPQPKRRPKRTKPSPKHSPARNTRPASQPIGHAIELDELNNRLGYFVRRVQVWIFQDFIRRLSSIDVSPAQFSVLVVIGANAGLSQAELATTLGIERARLVRLLNRLELRGLIRRLPSDGDGRRHALQLTREGQKVLTQAKALAGEHEAGLQKRLGAERYRMILTAMRELYSEDGSAARRAE